MKHQLATFDDRYTMRYVRLLSHPIDEIWAAVTQADQINLWLMPVTEIEPRLGGRCLFSWGGPTEQAEQFTVTVFEAPRRVRYAGRESALEFVLEPEGDATRLTFLHLFASDHHIEAMDGEPGGGLPAGPDSPWRPGLVAGFHLALDRLGEQLSAGLSPQRMAELSAERIAQVQSGGGGREAHGYDSDAWHRLVEAYRQLLGRSCPPGGSARYDDERPAS